MHGYCILTPFPDSMHCFPWHMINRTPCAEQVPFAGAHPMTCFITKYCIRRPYMKERRAV